MRKQSKAQITGREGERWFAAVLPPEWSIQRPIDDFGLDGIVALGSSTHVMPFEFGVQVKSSSRFMAVKEHIVVPRIPRDTIRYWLAKFFPTLLVAYDSKKKIGYFEWVSNLVDRAALDSATNHFYLHVPKKRVISPDCWIAIESELTEFHREFSAALQTTREIVPMAAEFAILLRNLCLSNTADRADRGGNILYATLQAWTHIEVIRRLDELLPNVLPSSIAARNLKSFRESYFEVCDRIFLKFSELCQTRDVGWIMMKKDSEAALDELTAMLADCVSGLLRHASRSD